MMPNDISIWPAPGHSKPPLLAAIGGLSGTGKSVLACELAGPVEPPPGAVIIRSDVVRKHLFDVSETTPLPESAYQAETTQRVYDTLSNTASRVLTQGCSVVLDAAFLQEVQRAEPASLARKHAPLPRPVPDCRSGHWLARIEQRKSDASDATRDVGLMQETLAIGAVDWHMVDAWGTPDQSLRSARVLLLEPAPGEG